MPYGASGGNRVTMTVTAAFDAIPNEYAAPSNTSQGAIWLGTNGCFQVWTRLRQGYGGQAENGWVDVEADGITPATGVDYTFRFVFDYAAKTYGVEVQTGLTEFTRLRDIQSTISSLSTVNMGQLYFIYIGYRCYAKHFISIT